MLTVPALQGRELFKDIHHGGDESMTRQTLLDGEERMRYNPAHPPCLRGYASCGLVKEDALQAGWICLSGAAAPQGTYRPRPW